MDSVEEYTPLLVNKRTAATNSEFFKTILPFLFLQCSVGLCASLQATFYPIEAESKGATAAQFGAVFGIIHLSLFIFGKCFEEFFLFIETLIIFQDLLLANIFQFGESSQSFQLDFFLMVPPSSSLAFFSGLTIQPPSSYCPTLSDS